MLNLKTTIATSIITLTVFASTAVEAGNLCNQVWKGEVERVRVQEQASGETVMRLYIYPGNNADYAGYTESSFMFDALTKAQDKSITVQGYTDSSCKIKWVDIVKS